MMNTNHNLQNMDPIDQLIVNRLGERDRKLKQMEKWNSAKRTSRLSYTMYSVISIAACFVVLFYAFPLTKNGEAQDDLAFDLDMTSFRSADFGLKKVVELIEDKDYESALEECKKQLRQSDAELRLLNKVNEHEIIDEEQEYETELLKTANEEILWTNIFLLVKTNRISEASTLLECYLEGKKYTEHQAEALMLKEKIKKMKK